MIAVTFALPSESSDFQHRLVHPGQIEPGVLPSVLGNLEKHEVMICHTGVGVRAARERMRSVLSLEAPQLVLSSGFAGGLAPFLTPGTIVVGEKESDPYLVRKAMAAGATPARVITTDRPVEEPSAKTALYEKTGAEVVDMETEAVVAACQEAGVPLLVARAVLDAAQDALPVPFDAWFDVRRQRPRKANLLRYLATHRKAIGPFFRFVQNVQASRSGLTDFLVQLIRTL